jgi:uncharacterized RmlC-like cupin family protein
MKAPAIRGLREHRFRKAKFRHSTNERHNERGITMALVAISMVAIIAIAALSIDVVTLFLAREEAQRAADAGALAAARMISFSGLTSDPNNNSGVWACVCGTPGPNCGAGSGTNPPPLATAAANAAAGQSTVSNAGGNATAFTVNVTYLQIASGATNSNTDCTTFIGKDGTFATNPMVTVQVSRTGLPTFFSRAWGYKGNTTNASATAEAFNPSYSATISTSSAITPVQPRCVKPWFVPNQDPLNPQPSPYCNNGTACKQFVNTTGTTAGQIYHPGISTDTTGATGVVGERFTLFPDCRGYGTCHLHTTGGPQPAANYPVGGGGGFGGGSHIPASPNLAYVPGQVSGTPVAIPTSPISAVGDTYQEAIGGCDQTTVYQCGVQSTPGSGPNFVDLTINPAQPAGGGYTTIGVMALTHQTSDDPTAQPSGQDYLSTYGVRSTYLPQILAGSSNPLGISGDQITASNSIVSLPIYDSANNTVTSSTTSAVTVVGFLQVFINSVDQYGNVDVSVMNVVGCGNGNGTTLNQAVTGSSPIPVRLISPPTS